jgi:diphthamide synthase (EF-2-diphthine--ammonia ligase)
MPELFDPHRDRSIVTGLERLYSGCVNYTFYSEHIDTDQRHGLRWLQNVITPILEEKSSAGLELACGGAIRLEAMRRYNQYLATRFGLI